METGYRYCKAIIYWDKNLGFAYFQILLVACQRFAMAKTFDSSPS